MITAVIGAGRMGSYLGLQLPKTVEKIIIDTDKEKAKQLAQKIGGSFSNSLKAAEHADIIALVLPAPAVLETAKELMKICKSNTVIMNMATNGSIKELAVNEKAIHFVDVKIVGHAVPDESNIAMYVIADTKNIEIFKRIEFILQGFQTVVMGNADIVSVLSTIGVTEAIKAAVSVKKALKQYDVPKELEDIVIQTVCAGTMKAYVKGDLGPFARELAKKLEQQ